MPRKKLWGGRFTRPTLRAIERFTHSFEVDQRLARYDLLGSMAHARMLGKRRIIPPETSRRLLTGLQGLFKALASGRLRLNPQSEDVHTALQLALAKRVGKAADYLHTARSRNDQVVTSLRLYLKNKLKELDGQIRKLMQEILLQAERARGLVMPGFTHLRHAQPVLVSHLLLSYLPGLQRDRGRLQGAFHRIDELPLGSGALVGTNLPIHRQAVAQELTFSRIMENSVDAVSARDFVAETLSCLAILGVHLSRIAEDLILWSTREFGFLRLGEQLLTGSSMMPQKQNPDFLELVRAGVTRITGNLSGLLTLLKGLPTGYQRDLQNDKELLFEALDRTESMLQALGSGFKAIRWNRQNLTRELSDESLYATDLAEFLVTRGVPFLKAHQAVGELLRFADKKRRTLRELSLADFRRFSPAFRQEVYSLLDPAVSVRRKKSQGSTHPRQVEQAIRRWKGRLIQRGKGRL